MSTEITEMAQPFTGRDGKTLDLSTVLFELSYGDKSGIMSLRDELAKRGNPMGLSDVISEVITRGVTQWRNSLKWGDVNRQSRNVEKQATADISDLLGHRRFEDLSVEEKAIMAETFAAAQAKKLEIRQAARKGRR